MEKKTKIHEFDLGIYPRKVWIVNKCKTNELSEMFCHRDFADIDFSDEEGNESASTVYPMIMNKETGRYGVLVVLRNKLSVAQISHEAGHVATSIFQDIGAYLDPNNQEPFMYLLGYIAGLIDEVIKNKF